MADSVAVVVNVTIQGSGPYGFRLSGGDGEPMTITKLRRQGKAHQAGLHEGDTVLGINGFSSRTMGHSAAMGLLESAVHSVELLVFRGPPNELSSAFNESSSRLRPLPAGAAPPPRVLPPPPSGNTGALVIDQPSFMRPHAERFVVDERPQAATPLPNGHDNYAEDHDGTSNKMLWQPSSAPAAHVSIPRQPWTSSFDPSDAIAAVPIEPPATAGWSSGLWQNAPSQTPARWTPQQLPPASDAVDSEPYDFRVAPSTDPKKPWMWKPPVTFQVQSTTVVAAPEPPAAWPLEIPRRDEREREPHQQKRVHDDATDGVPKWALPLRSDYDWKKSYPWMVDEYAVAEDDEWEYGYTSEGELVKRKKKIFADSSFYDDPNQKYPTIEEQIKMARRVAQSLTAATNVSARGQRMFLRRREKADRWIISELPPPTMAVLLRRGLVGARDEEHVAHVSSRHHDEESDSEMLYYNPAPWIRAIGVNNGGKATPKPVKTPTSGARLPWKSDFDISSSAAADAFRQSSPPPASQLGQDPKWKPHGSSFHGPEVSGRESVKDVTVPKFAAAGAPAFNVTKELRQMKGKGGKMFAKRRAQAAEDERREDLTETVRARAGQKMRGDDDWTDSAHALGNVEVDIGGNGWTRDQPGSGTPHRLLELIERSRASSPGRKWTSSTTSIVEQTHVKDPLAFGTFSAEVKSRGNFRPVRFKAPFGGADQYQAVAPTYSAPDLTPEGISDF